MKPGEETMPSRLVPNFLVKFVQMYSYTIVYAVDLAWNDVTDLYYTDWIEGTYVEATDHECHVSTLIFINRCNASQGEPSFPLYVHSLCSLVFILYGSGKMAIVMVSLINQPLMGEPPPSLLFGGGGHEQYAMF